MHGQAGSIHVAATTSAIAFVTTPTPAQAPGEHLNCVRNPVRELVLAVCVQGPGVGGQRATACTSKTVYVTTSVNVTCPPILLLGAVVAGTEDEVVPGRTPPSVIEIVAEIVGEDANGVVEDVGGSPLLLAAVDDGCVVGIREQLMPGGQEVSVIMLVVKKTVVESEIVAEGTGSTVGGCEG